MINIHIISGVKISNSVFTRIVDPNVRMNLLTPFRMISLFENGI